jgi:hypothetical protein
VKVTWARPRTRNRSQRHDPNMRCYKCGQRGHFRYDIRERRGTVFFLCISKFSRECDGQMTEGRASRRRETDRGRFASNYRRYSRYSLVTNLL